MKITRNDIDDYEQNGVTCIRSVISEPWVDKMYRASVELMKSEQHPYEPNAIHKIRVGDISTVESDPGRFFVGVFMSEQLSVFRDFVMQSPLAAVAGSLMRSGVARFFYDQIFIKEPATQSPTLWHQDMPFWPLTGSHLISCWVALTPVTKESSGVEYVAGSHKWNKLYRATSEHAADESLELAPDFSLPENRIGQRFLSWNMKPGDVVFHHPLVVHGAGGNRLAQRRVGLSIRYIGDDVHWAPRTKAMKLAREPMVAPGEYPGDDTAFPIAWQKRSS